MDADQLKAIGGRIVAAREALGWTQSQLATETGLTDNTVRKAERGERVAPGTLRKILDAVGIEPVAATQKRVGYPADVEIVRDLVGMYLVALPEGERAPVAYDLTRFLMERGASSVRSETNE